MTIAYPRCTASLKVFSLSRSPSSLLYGVRKMRTGYLPEAAGRRTSARNTTLSRIGTETFFSTNAFVFLLLVPHPGRKTESSAHARSDAVARDRARLCLIS